MEIVPFVKSFFKNLLRIAYYCGKITEKKTLHPSKNTPLREKVSHPSGGVGGGEDISKEEGLS